MSSKVVTLDVNGNDVLLSFFVQTFFDKVLDGMVGALESACQVETLELKAGAGDTTLTVNGTSISMNEFVRTAFRNTTRGMISSLRGIDKIDTFIIRIGGGK
ncbi:hypothetical protein ABFB09_04120 [Dehalogenimonas sp. THU2]|uniref:hypothetical protein n=1 Tax=Dehalogenimonas sp. THU2 TaxID=3151121 RepID=UPI0032187E88